MRHRYVFRPDPDRPGHVKAVEIDLDAPLPPRVTPYIRRDIEPYRSLRTGEIISSRGQHQEHLRRYGLVEVGNEWQAMTQPPPQPGPAPGEVGQEVKRQLERDPGERRAEAERVLHAAGYEGPQVERIIGGDS